MQGDPAKNSSNTRHRLLRSSDRCICNCIIVQTLASRQRSLGPFSRFRRWRCSLLVKLGRVGAFCGFVYLISVDLPVRHHPCCCRSNPVPFAVILSHTADQAAAPTPQRTTTTLVHFPGRRIHTLYYQLHQS